MDREREREKADKQIFKDKLFAIGAGIICALLLVTIGYVLIYYSDSFFIVAILAVMLVISLFVMISAMLSSGRRTKEQDKEDYNEIAKAQKAQYLIIKKNFEELTSRMAKIERGSGAVIPTEEIIEAQKAVAKITISRSKENAEAVINSNDALHEKVEEFEGRLKSNNQTILDEQRKLLAETKAEIANQNRNLENRLLEMQRTLSAIEQNQRLIGNQPPVMMVAQAMPPQGMQPIQPMMQQPYVAPAPAPIMEAPVSEPAPAYTPTPEPVKAEPQIPEPEPSETVISEPAGLEPEPAVMDVMSPIEEAVPAAENTFDAIMPDMPVEETVLDTPIPETSEELPMPDINELLNADITAEAAPQAAEPEISPEPLAEPEPALAPEIKPVSDDPNAMLDPDQIAAMFAQASAPAPEPEPAPAPVIEPVSDDPNAMLDPDQIAAMFAQASAAPEPAPAPVIEPVSDDPNAQLTPDQIAAMFAQVDEAQNAASAPAPEPPKIEPVSDDPNAQLTPDQIAAMFAQVDEAQNAASAPAPDPAPAPVIEPVSDDPNAQLTPEQIAAMFAQVR